jgi:hypothetical protein
MHKNIKLILDASCETHQYLNSYATDFFYDFASHNPVLDAVYVIGRTQFANNKEKIRTLIENHNLQVVFCNPFEGSETLRLYLISHGVEDLILAKKLLVVSGGDLEPSWTYMLYDFFLPKIHEFDENKEACSKSDEIYSTLNKPYKFLFLNMRGRSHRKWMIEYLDHNHLLDSAIWSWLDPSSGTSRGLHLTIDGNNLMNNKRDINVLAQKYEIPKYHKNLNVKSGTVFSKYELFDREWGEIYINLDSYIDTYFSVVTETVFEYPYSFRTEKIWKPIAMTHPWIAVANRGFYRDIRNLGFQTFNHVIDESFDLIDNNQDRIERIGAVIKDLCQQDLAIFLKECYTVCKYNQQHLLSIREPTKNAFANRFLTFLKDNQWMT